MGSVQQAQEVFSVQEKEHHEGEEDTDSLRLCLCLYVAFVTRESKCFLSDSETIFIRISTAF